MTVKDRMNIMTVTFQRLLSNFLNQFALVKALHLSSAQTSQEGIEAKEQLRSYCLIYILCSQVFVKLILLAFDVKDNILENNLALIIEKEWGDKLQVKVGQVGPAHFTCRSSWKSAKRVLHYDRKFQTLSENYEAFWLS